MTGYALRLESFGVSFGDRVILSNVTFDLPRVGLSVLVGPAGGGKSTLLRTLVGLNDAHPALGTWGTAKLGPEGHAVLVMQHARFFLDTVRENLVSALPNRAALAPSEQTAVVVNHLVACGLRALTAFLDTNAVELPLPLQRRLAVARALMCEPSILFADEPTAGLDDHEAIDVVAMLRAQARARAILLVTHNQRLALAAGGTTLLLAGGRIREQTHTRDFFADEPTTDAGREFVRTGGCNAASAHGTIPPASVEVTSRFVGPRGFFWVIAGHLGGLPRPGIIDELEHDLDGLERLDVSVLVTLEEQATVDPAALEARHIRSVHFPVVDMGVPAIDATFALCADLERWIERGDVVAVHCRAGLGRTGTILACHLVWLGRPACEAIDTIRAINPRCIQSNAQVEFLRQFEIALRGPATLGANADDRRQGDHTKWH